MKMMRKLIQNVCMASLWAFLAFSVCSCSCSGGKKQGSSKPRTYVEAVSTNDYATAHEILDKLHMQAIAKNSNLTLYGPLEANRSLEVFWAAADHIYKSEMMYLIEMQDPAANMRLINTLAMMNVIGEKPTSSIVKDYFLSGKNRNYSIFITRYNRLCDEILNTSIIYNNKEMAKAVLNLYKDDCVFLGAKSHSDHSESWHFDMTPVSKPAAMKKYKEAIANGLLD